MICLVETCAFRSTTPPAYRQNFVLTSCISITKDNSLATISRRSYEKWSDLDEMTGRKYFNELESEFSGKRLNVFDGSIDKQKEDSTMKVWSVRATLSHRRRSGPRDRKMETGINRVFASSSTTGKLVVSDDLLLSYLNLYWWLGIRSTRSLCKSKRYDVVSWQHDSAPIYPTVRSITRIRKCCCN